MGQALLPRAQIVLKEWYGAEEAVKQAKEAEQATLVIGMSTSPDAVACCPPSAPGSALNALRRALCSVRSTGRMRPLGSPTGRATWPSSGYPSRPRDATGGSSSPRSHPWWRCRRGISWHAWPKWTSVIFSRAIPCPPEERGTVARLLARHRLPQRAATGDRR